MPYPNFIYADNAATTKISESALEKWCEVSRNCGGNPSGLYSFGVQAKRELQNARNTIAELIGAEPCEIFFTSGGSESDNWGIKGAAALRVKSDSAPGTILLSPTEHHAVLNSAEHLKRRFGIETDFLPADKYGRISPADFQDALKPQTFLAAVMLANNEIGTVQDIASLAETARSRNVLFLTDAVQGIGHIPVNVRSLGIDLLSASAHKFNGPKGVGFLYVRKSLPFPSFIDGGQQESQRRAGTENVAGAAAMAAALRDHIDHLNSEIDTVSRIAARFRTELQNAVPDVVFNGDPENRLPGIVSLSLPNISGESLLHLLDLHKIAVSTGAACNSQETEISHVLRAVGLPENLARGTLRVSFSAENTLEEAAVIAAEIAKARRKIERFTPLT